MNKKNFNIRMVSDIFVKTWLDSIGILEERRSTDFKNLFLCMKDYFYKKFYEEIEKDYLDGSLIENLLLISFNKSLNENEKEIYMKEFGGEQLL